MSDHLPAVVTADPMPMTTIGPEQVALIKRTICRGSSDDELALFVGQCKRTGLDPFSRQIHAVKRWDAKAQREVMTIQVGIDGFRLVAQRTGERDGHDGPYWRGLEGEWTDVWLDVNPPAAAKMVIYRKGHTRPYTGIATYQSFVQTTKDGAPNKFWRQMPDVMLAKVAEAMALRMAFPMELSGLYLPEEMAETPQEQPPTPQERPETIGIEGAKWLMDLARSKDANLRQLCEPFQGPHVPVDRLSRADARRIAEQIQRMPDVQATRDQGAEMPKERPAQETIGPDGAKWIRDLAKAKGAGLRKLCEPYLDQHAQIESLSREDARRVADELKAMPDVKGQEPDTPTSSAPPVSTAEPAAPAWQGLVNKYRDTIPPTGEKCKAYINAIDAQMSSEGRCLAGDLVAHVNRAAAVEQLPGDWSTWNGSMIEAAIAIAREFAAKCPKAK